MRLILEKRKGGWEASLELEDVLARVPLRDFLRPKVDAHKHRRAGQGRTYIELMADACIDHSQYHSYISGHTGFTLGILHLLVALGYDVKITKEQP